MKHQTIRPQPLAILLVGAALSASIVAAAQEAPPLTIPYRGVLFDADGGVEGTVDIDAALFTELEPTDDEEALWSESFVGVEVSGGIFELSLGSGGPVPLDVLEQGPLYLSLTIDGETLSPRLPIESVPYARLVERSRETANADGLVVGNVEVVDADGNWVGSTLTLEGLGCESEQIPIWDGEAWICRSLTEDDTPLALAGQFCDDMGLAVGIDDSGLPECVDGGALVTESYLDENGYVTSDDVTEQGFYSPGNRPTMAAFDNVPPSIADGVDNDRVYSGSAPIAVSGTTISLSGNGCQNGEVLGYNGSQFECTEAPALSCQVRSGSGTVNCQGNEVMTGGGFQLSDGNNDAVLWVQATGRPNGNGFECGLTTGPGGSPSNTCYAVCCTYQ